MEVRPKTTVQPSALGADGRSHDVIVELVRRVDVTVDDGGVNGIFTRQKGPDFIGAAEAWDRLASFEAPLFFGSRGWVPAIGKGSMDPFRIATRATGPPLAGAAMSSCLTPAAIAGAAGPSIDVG